MQDKKKETDRSIEQMVQDVRKGKISRRKLILGLTALGVTSAGAAVVASSLRNDFIPIQNQQHLQLHDTHVQNQLQGNVHNMMQDYHENAVVEDPLFAQPFTGRDAIATRYAAEVNSVPDRQLNITNRIVAGNQLIIEWEATGTHQNDFMGFGGTGKQYTLKGTTVVTRQDGKIVRESHYYNVNDLKRQIEGPGTLV